MRNAAKEPLGLAVVLIVILAGTAVLLGAGDKGSSREGQGQIDGIVINAQQGTVVFNPEQPLDGKRQVSFEVRPRDATAVDVQHLKEHSAQGLRTRMFYERSGGKLYAVGQEDLPGTTSPGGAP